MAFIRDTLLQRVASVMLPLYVGAFLGQALCVLPPSHMESRTPVAAGVPAAHATSQHGEHSSAPPRTHSGRCAVVACGSAVTSTPDFLLATMGPVSTPEVAYPDGTTPPEPEIVLPPPRLG